MNRAHDPLEFACPHCQARVQAAPEQAGQRIQCVHCHKRLKVPGSVATERRSRASDYAYRQMRDKPETIHDPEQLRDAPVMPDLPATDARRSAPPSKTARPQPRQPDHEKPSSVRRSTTSRSSASAHVSSPDELDSVDLEPLPSGGGGSGSELPFGLSDLGQTADLFEGLPDRPTRTRAQVEAEAAREEAQRIASQPPDPNELFPVRCQVCDSVLMARYRQIGSTLRCSDCHTDVRIIAPEESRRRRKQLGPGVAEPLPTPTLSGELAVTDDDREYRLAEPVTDESVADPTPIAKSTTLDDELDAYLDGADLDDLAPVDLDSEGIALTGGNLDGPVADEASSNRVEDDFGLSPLEEEPPRASNSQTSRQPWHDATSTVEPRPVARMAKQPEEHEDIIIGDSTSTAQKPPTTARPRHPSGGSIAGNPDHPNDSDAEGQSAWTQPYSPTPFRPRENGAEGRTISNGEELLDEHEGTQPRLEQLTMPILLGEVKSVLSAPSVLLAAFLVALVVFGETTCLTWFQNSIRDVATMGYDPVAQRVASIKMYMAMIGASFMALVLLVQLSYYGSRLIQATAAREKNPDITAEFSPFDILSEAMMCVVPYLAAMAPAIMCYGFVNLVTHSLFASRLAAMIFFWVFPTLIMSVMRSGRVYAIFDADVFRSLSDQLTHWRTLWIFTGGVVALFALCLFIQGFRSYALNILISPLIAVGIFLYLAAVGIAAHVIGGRIMNAPQPPTS